MQKVEEAFNFAQHAAYWFEHGPLQEKRRVTVRLGSNYILKDGKLNIDMGELWLAFSNASAQLHKDVMMLELTELGQVNEKNHRLCSRDFLVAGAEGIWSTTR